MRKFRFYGAAPRLLVPGNLKSVVPLMFSHHATPISSALDHPVVPRLGRTPRANTVMVVSENTGRPYQESDFQHTFAELRDKAGLPATIQFRDLRRTVATALGAAGCTDDQIRAITGHRTREVVGVYVIPDQSFAKSAMGKLQRARREQKVSRS